jgi:Flp pilus assembly protein TadD
MRRSPTNPRRAGLSTARIEPGRIAPIALVAAALLAYGNSLQGSFVYDDQPAIRENPHIRALWPPSLVLAAPPEAALARRPVVGVSFAVNYALGGLDVRGYHVVNIAIHVAVTLLVFALLARALGGPRPPRGSGRAPETSAAGERGRARAVWLAAATALLWTTHPLLTDAVDYVVQRTELLMSLFLLLTIAGIARAADSARPARWLGLSVFACALGMASKEVMVVAPLLALLYDRAFLSGSFASALRSRGRAYAALAATWLLLGALIVVTPSTQRAGALAEILRPVDYLMTQAGVILHYLRLAIWPAPLSIVYDDWTIARGVDALVLGAVVVALLAVTVWLQRARPGLGFAGAWFFLILAPTSSLLPIPSEIAAERRMYLPLVAVIAVLVLAYDRGIGGVVRRKWALAPVLLAALALGGATRARNEVYRDEAGIWRDVLGKHPRSVTARINLGYLFEREGRLAEALALYEDALARRPESSVARTNVGAVHLAMGRPEEAVSALREAVRLAPDFARARVNLGAALIAARRVGEGVEELEEAVRLDPWSVKAHNNLGFGYALQERHDAALSETETAVRLDPVSAKVRFNRAFALKGAGRGTEAVAELREATRLDPSLAEAYLLLAETLADAGRYDEAEEVASRGESVARTIDREDLAGVLGERRREYRARGQGGGSPAGGN